MKRSAKIYPSYIIVRIEPNPLRGLDVTTKDLASKVQALVVGELGDSGRCATVATMRPGYPPHAPHDLWKGSGGLTRQDVPAP